MSEFAQYKEAVEDFLESLPWNSCFDSLFAYVLQNGGKRLRPILVCLGYRLFEKSAPLPLYSAAAIELLHNFTLVHDDWMDKALLRRGKLPLYKHTQPEIAILTGDALFAFAYWYLLQDPIKNAKEERLKVFTEAAIKVCEGQYWDLYYIHHPPKEREYLEMIKLKTAALLKASVHIGALAANASKKVIASLVQWCEALGILFQLQDDYLDLFSDKKAFGKERGGDIIEGKRTIIWFTAQKHLPEKERQTFQYLYERAPRDEAAIEEIFHLLKNHGIDRHIIKTLQKKALYLEQQLKNFPFDTAPLKTLLNYLINRQQ